MDQDFEFFKIIFLVVGVLVLARLVALLSGPTEQKRKRQCDIHKWSVNPATKLLECTECRFIAGSHKTEGGDY